MLLIILKWLGIKMALKYVQQYLSIMPMLNTEFHQQLSSTAGDKYTKEQANYAISHIPK